MTIFKAYDIRGIYKKELTEQKAYLIGYYLAKYLNLKKIKIAHDLRLSYQSLTKYLIKGLLDSNCEIIYLGASSTPNFYFSLFKGINSGVVVTASHNPKEYNGFKIMYKLNSFDSKSGLYELEKLILNDPNKIKDKFKKIDSNLEKIDLNQFLKENKIKKRSSLNSYVDFLYEKYNQILTKKDIKNLNSINFNLDYSSGMSSLAGIKFLKKTNLNYTLLNKIPDGNFPIHPPDPQKAKDFIKNLKSKSNFSVVFDGDGDRILFFDENNNFIFPDYIIALFIEYFSNQNQKNKNFVVDLRISKILVDIAKKNNLNLELIRVGRAFYKNYMDKNNCRFGAELSGHIFFSDFNNLDNPDIAIIYMLKIIAIKLDEKKEFKFSDLINKYIFYTKIEETNLKVKNPDLVLNKLKQKYQKNISMQIDGLSFDFKNYWFNIRKSNTEPIIRINFEGKNKKQTKLEFEKLIKQIKSFQSFQII